jgi:VanZ family protein
MKLSPQGTQSVQRRIEVLKSSLCDDCRNSRIHSLLRYWLPFLVYAALILAISSQATVPGASRINDKLAHATEYAIFAFLFARALQIRLKKYPAHLAMLILLGSAAFAAFDEHYQSYVPGRNSSVFDWYADLAGITFVFTLVLLLRTKEQPATRL